MPTASWVVKAQLFVRKELCLALAICRGFGGLIEKGLMTFVRQYIASLSKEDVKLYSEQTYPEGIERATLKAFFNNEVPLPEREPEVHASDASTRHITSRAFEIYLCDHRLRLRVEAACDRRFKGNIDSWKNGGDANSGACLRKS